MHDAAIELRRIPPYLYVQRVILPAQEVASRIVAELAEEVLAFKERIESIDEEIGQRFFARPEARILRVACRAHGTDPRG